MQVLSNRTRGFTIIELIVVLAVAGIMFTVVLDTLGGYYQDNSVSLGRGVQETDTRSVLRSIEKDLYSSIGFGADVTDTTLVFANAAPFGSGGSNSDPWSYLTNGRGPVLIAYKNPVTQQADADSANTRTPVFLQPPGGCSDLSGATPALTAQIYFVGLDPADNTKLNLYRRTIVPNSTATPLCGTMVPANSSCAATTRASNPTLCRATDAVLLKDIKSFNVDYYMPNDPNPYDHTYDAGYDPIDRRTHIEGAQAIEITIETYQRLTNDTASNTNTASIRINHL